MIGTGRANPPLQILRAPPFRNPRQAQNAREEVQAGGGARERAAPPPRPSLVPLQVVVARRLDKGAEHAPPVPRRQAEDPPLPSPLQLEGR
ncbi:hypothetical protein glysoja_009240 [Glycine soja]|nr:hypothetical protein glysoja_009240 [Glycine soja]